ncbi:MAG: glycosyltransferase family 2 protein [Cytophagia bacterium]|nr:MAG: glycosyltransferase family 2 protein [Cytophagales bacterium]TAG41249.1 MAG: glycosyltransferase family 2 protein [Cytophagia bacterium]TAG72050.1 MAG: glycosyltransferase family 2 protein [Runella slithyformis]TAG82934.1 MAG: glycosyltransferase family 2 protein [Cytophagales bacterium]
MKIAVIIPAHNEQGSIDKVINEIPNIVSEIIVVNNNSSDNTAAVAQKAGATVLFEPNAGYGYACLKGIEHLNQQSTKVDIVVFLDGDYSDYPEELTQIVAPIIERNVDFVIGARKKELRQAGSMTPQQIFGNWLATNLMRLLYQSKFSDLGPFRAIKYQKLQQLNMTDKTYGWTVEMQLKALRQKLTYEEVPLRYKKRIGTSKISGTIKGTVMAGIKIIGWIVKYTAQKK